MNRVVHFEIQSDDLDKAEKFYRDVFGWEMQNMGAEMGNYRVITTGTEAPGINGGLTPRAGEVAGDGYAANAYVCIIGVDDIDMYIGKIKSAGGRVALEKMDVPNVGLLAYFKDPDGNTFGILQPSPAMPR